MNNKIKIAVGTTLGVVAGIGLGFTTAMYGSNNENLKENAQQKIQYINQIIESVYIFDYEEDDLIDSMVEGYVYGLGDPYSTYFNEEEYAKFMEATEGHYVGIGCVVSVDVKTNKITIVKPFENSPAMNAGIKAGDKIIAVDGREVTGEDLDLAISLMKGKENTEVVVTILRGPNNEEMDFTITRGEITIDTVNHEMLDDKIGYIQITGFDEVTSNQFHEAYNQLNDDNMESLIIDLRNNPGGLLNIVSEIADTILPEGVIVSTKDKNGREESISSDARKIEIPLVVLVNENSASASEVLSGAIKDYKAGTIVGETTFGKGIVQRIFPIGDGTAVKITISEFFTPSGYALHGKGIEPDVVVDVSEEDAYAAGTLPLEEDEQLQKAIEILTK